MRKAKKVGRIPVVVYVYGNNGDGDLMQDCTVAFEAISFRINTISHGSILYRPDSFIVVHNVEEPLCFTELLDYLGWNKGMSMRERIRGGFSGEFWLMGNTVATTFNPGKIAMMSINCTHSMNDILRVFALRAGLDIKPSLCDREMSKWDDATWTKMLSR